MPEVISFDAVEMLGSGLKGLKTQDNSNSRAEITGTGLSGGMTVKVWNTDSGPNSEPRWSGPLQETGSGGFFAKLKCTNTTFRKDRPTETENVSVTVGGSPVYNKPDPVNQGP